MSSKTIYENDLEVVGTATVNNLTVTGVLNATADFTSVLTSTNTTASTSNTTGGVVLDGGIGISNTADAVDSTNGGTITTAGGAAIAKKLMVGDTVVIGTDVSTITPLASTRLFIVGNTTSGLGFQRSGASINSTGINTSNEMVFSLQSAANFKFQTGQSDYNVAGTIGMSIGTAQISTAIATESSSSITGSFITAGGAGIAKKLYVGTDLSIGGNVTSGTWNAGVISATYGGTGAATLTSNAVLLGNGTGTIQSPSTITYATSTLTLPKLVSNDTTDSSSSITGAVITAGGLGVAKKLYVGTNLFTGSNVGIGTTTANAPLQFASTLANRVIVLNETANNDHQYHGFGVQTNILRYQVPDTTDSHVFYAATSSSTSDELGRILGTGGAQFSLIQGSTTASANLTLRSTTNATKGYVYLDETTESSSTSTGALRIDGGVGIAKKLFVGGGEINLTNGTSNILNYGVTGAAAPTQTTRSVGTKIVINSGVSASSLDYAVGVEEQNMWFSVPNGVGGDGFKWYTGNSVTNIMRLGSSQLNLTVATESSSSTSGSFITAGGMGIAKKLYVGTDLSVGGTVTLTTALSVANGGTGATTSTGTGAVVLANAPSLLTSLSVTNGSNSLSYNGTGVTITRASGGSNITLTTPTSGFSAFDTYTNSANTVNFYSGLDGTGFSTINTGGGLIATSGANPNKSIMIAPAFANMMTIDTTGVDIVGTTATTSNITGILKLAGGIGISNTTEATSSTNGGTITTAGGAAIAKKLFVGGDLSVTGSIVTPAIAKMSPVYIRGSGLNNLVNQLVKVGGTTHANTSNVGLTLTIINAATHALTSTTAYDTSTSGAASTSLATAIDNLDRQQICILTSYSSFTGAMNAALRTSARRLGLYKLAETTTVSTAYCSIFKGQGTGDPNTGKNNQVVEYLSDDAATSDFATIATWIIDDSISIDTLPSLLVNPSPISTIPAVYVNNSGYVGINTITPTSNLQIEGATGSTSSTSGSVLMNGGLGISNATDAISSTNGGTITTAGGAAIAKKLFVGGGEINLTNGTSNILNYGVTGAAAPTQTTRSVGTKIVINSGVSESSLDYAIGVEVQNMWFSVPNGVGGDGFKWYTGNDVTNIMRLGSSQLNLTVATESSSSTSGSFITAGGMGIAKKLYVGTNTNTRSLTVTGILDAADRSICGNANFGLIYSADVKTIASHLFCSADANTEYIKINSFTAILEVLGISQFTGAITSTSTTASTSNTEGSLKLSGGIGISNTTDATSSVNGGTITTAGGAAIAKKLYVGGYMYADRERAIFEEQQTSGTNGGSFTAASYNKRVLNTTVVNNISGCSISTDVITLGTGTYHVTATTPAYNISRFRARFRNTSDSTTAILGDSCFTSGGSSGQSHLTGIVTIASNKNFELHTYAQSAGGGDAGGVSVSSGEVEVYSRIEITRIL